MRSYYMFKFLIVLIFIAPSFTSYGQESPSDVTKYGQNTTVGKYADINGIKFYYEIYGNGAPLVLIHGNGDSIAGMAAQIEYFSKHYKVIVADSRGHGNSGLGTEQLTYEQMMEDWNALLDKLDVHQAKIFGWSDGGILGLLLTINHPDKVGKLATMGANLRPDDTAVQSWVRPILADATRHIEEMIAAKDTTENWGLQMQLMNLLKTQPNISPESLHQIKIPVLVMAGDRDVIRGEHSLEIFHNLENSHLAILPGNTHFAPVNSPDKINALLNDFFANPFTMPTTKEIMEQQ